jgi:hypothetical protein
MLTHLDLLGLGLLSSIQNLMSAGVERSPSGLGIYIMLVDIIQARFVADMLRIVEEKYLLVVTALLDVFFPESMRVNKDNVTEKKFRGKALEARYQHNKHGTRLHRLPLV